LKTLLVMRHAKSDWNADYGKDHDRPLNERGVRSARIMGRILAAEGLAPDRVVTSTAVRARATADLASEAGQWRCEVVPDSTLYGTGVGAAVQVASGVSGSDRLMLVGHQPTWSILVSVLTGERAEMKTATVATIDFDISEWDQLPSVEGSLRQVYEPRPYFDTEFDTG
jgi:phosphohistidine phosphatase